ATTLGRSGIDSAASRSRTRSISEPVMPRGDPAERPGAPAAQPGRGGPPPPAPNAVPAAARRARVARPAVGRASWTPAAVTRRSQPPPQPANRRATDLAPPARY